MNFLGIDPGVHGGMALLNERREVVLVQAFDQLSTEWDLFGAVVSAASLADHVALERVGYRPGDGGKGGFTFGQGYGALRAMIMAAGHTPLNILPQVWQGRLVCLTGGNKAITLATARLTFPTVAELDMPRKKGLANSIADALLIAEYCRRLKMGG